MSKASKLTLLGTSLFALGTVVFVHYQQKAEQQAMHQGVIRDMEQQRLKRERQADFDMQRALEAEYKKDQSVRDTTAEMDPALSNRGGLNVPVAR
ncbi:uncharacterized protein PODANS_4_1690 [Podospora anserina S mat+]|uniref:Podospora anserina S mat+ genomic DNA chromosome 4, supercontig 1 n=1 Tax=Podospora anserina (strain S / ATCC MYA-4624 / DSM 980 / FGSC 10383) TaxID=515849 RepID=B2ADP8_PODAN|nr:uncharacterized protein PODANS_4_1690 [Podospora anserina S mat+]CAP61563.1 unnamed protein product [Podospora anserina S mat+]CDP27917.1 Putative protein of unknown function [Podospora anserina S mat+]